jgi:LacI family transcriptional regulator
MVTIYDIAKITGYSAATISRALSGSGSINEETRSRILKAAEITGYKPNAAARSLITKHSKLIGVIVENESFANGLEHPLFGGIINCFRERVEGSGYDLMYLSKRLNNGMSYIDHCKYRNVEGILIVCSQYDDPEINKLSTSGIPCVSSNEFIPGISTVVCENTLSARRGVEYFLNKGHRKIGFIGGPFQIRSPASIERCEGYKQALKSAGIHSEEKYIEKADGWDIQAGINALDKLYSRAPELTAIFCASDTLAAGAMQCLQWKGKHVPQDVSLIGFDDSLVASCCTPPLTTFRQSREKIANACADKLISAINGNNNYEIMRIPAELIERESVAEAR